MNVEITFDSDVEQEKFINEIEENKEVIVAGIKYEIDSFSTGFFGNTYIKLKKKDLQNG
jgi:hypothetical protein